MGILKKEKKILNKITIVIFSHSRHDSLKKKILLYKNKYRLIILDRTEQSLADFCNLYLDKKSLYFHYPKKTYFKRFFLLKELLKTSYIAVQTDDDFFFEDNIVKSIIFLEKNKDYSCVAGKAYKFSTMGNYIYLKNIFKNIFTLNSKDYLIRLAAIFNGNFGNIRYGVTRSKVFLKNLEILKKNYKIYNNEMYRIADIQFFLVYSILGKIKILNKIFYLRYFKNSRRNWPNSSPYMAIEMYKKFKNGGYDNFIKKTLLALKINNRKNQNIVNENLKKYLFHYSNQKKRVFIFKKFFKFFSLNRFIPPVLKDFLKFKMGSNGQIFNKYWHVSSNMKVTQKEYKIIINCKNYFEN